MVNEKGVVGRLNAAESEVARLRGLLSAANARVEMTEGFRRAAVQGNNAEAKAMAALNAWAALNSANELKDQLNHALDVAGRASLRWDVAVAYG